MSGQQHLRGVALGPLAIELQRLSVVTLLKAAQISLLTPKNLDCGSTLYVSLCGCSGRLSRQRKLPGRSFDIQDHNYGIGIAPGPWC